MTDPSIDENGCHKVVFNDYRPYSYEVSKDPVLYAGVFVHVMDVAAKYLGICYQQVASVDKTFGGLLPNGTWTGSMGMIHRKEVALGATVFGISYDRARAVDFTHVIMESVHVVIFKKPTAEADILGFVKPYTPAAWAVISVVCAVLVASWLLFFRVKEQIQTFKDQQKLSAVGTPIPPKPRGAKTEELRQSLMMMFRVLMAQSLENGSENKFERHLLGVWLLCGMMIGVIYKSNLMAMLISPKINNPVNSIEELVWGNKFIYGSVKGSLLHEVIKISSPESTYGRMEDVIVLVTAGSNTLYRLFNEQYIFLFLKNALLGLFTLPAFKSCPLVTAKHSFLPMSLALPMQPGWAFAKKFDRFIVGMTESGIIEHLEFAATRAGQRCLSGTFSDGVELRALEVKDFFGVLLLYSAGIALALLSFFIELCYRRNRRTNSNNNNGTTATVAEEGGTEGGVSHLSISL